MNWSKSIIIKIFISIAVLLVFAFIISKISPESIRNIIGEENVYPLVFILGILGGVSFVTATSFFATVVTFAVAGFNPFILALVAAPGMFIGDLFFFYIGSKAKDMATGNVALQIEKFSNYLKSKSTRYAQLFIYFYTGFTPLPGDFLMLALSIAGFQVKDIYIPTMLGNFTLILLLSLAGIYGYDSFF